MDSGLTGTRGLPSPFYRVSAKALIFDESGRILVFGDDHGEWEMPGGGWEFDDESIEACLQREFMDEVGVGLATVGGHVVCCWRDFADDARGHRLRLAVRATLASTKFKLMGDDGEVLTEARFVSKEEFLSLPFQPSERCVKNCVDQIWSSVEK
jgi:8-oxo-dGTP pyrophosphatase MutT (NUDIX family)